VTGAADAEDLAVADVVDTARQAPASPDGRTMHAVRGRRILNAVVLGVLAVGLLVTGLLAWISHAQFTRNEKRLLELRVRDVGSLLSSGLPNIQTPLASGAALADATSGDARKFARLVAPYVGTRPSHQFVSISLWRVGAIERGPIVVVGSAPSLTASGSAAQRFFAHAARTPKLSVIGLWPPTLMRVGYALKTPEPGARFVAYGESEVPPNRRSRFERNSAFSDLDYVLYLGPHERSRDLLVTSLGQPPIRGRQAKMTIPFGDTVLTLVVAPREPLSGTLPQRLPWIIAIVGVILSVGAAALTLRLIQRRQGAEDLAGRLERAVEENQRLYAEQRTIARTLQNALLPDELPQIDGMQAGARYEPGERGVEIGGDWYDVIALADRRVLLVVGDVSGRGLRAATTMASLRYAIHAYAAQDDSPATILAKLSKILDVKTAGQLATVLCVLVDVGTRQVTVSSAGHLPPLLFSGDHGEFVESDVGLPIGVQAGAHYTSRTVAAPPRATLLAFTDGLIERRGEPLDHGLARLRAAATARDEALPALLSRLVSELHREPSEDDTAIVGVRWTTA
jgi:serine phosphatase RsbU (regulator of sigma subunit)